MCPCGVSINSSYTAEGVGAGQPVRVCVSAGQPLVDR